MLQKVRAALVAEQDKRRVRGRYRRVLPALRPAPGWVNSHLSLSHIFSYSRYVKRPLSRGASAGVPHPVRSSHTFRDFRAESGGPRISSSGILLHRSCHFSKVLPHFLNNFNNFNRRRKSTGTIFLEAILISIFSILKIRSFSVVYRKP